MSDKANPLEFPISVVLVDDDEEFLKASRKNLEKEGFRVHTANNGTDGLDIVQQWRIDVAVVDLKMPCMDGMEFLKAIKKIQPLIEVILLTGYASVETAVEGIRLGAFDYLVKPQSRMELYNKINDAGKRKRRLQSELVEEEIKKMIRRSPT
jgi:DNA-binding NtrC family response regulator